MLDVPMDTCYECGREIEAGSAYPCPTECKACSCSLACVMAHREPDHGQDHECPRRQWRPPKFGERYAGERAPLSHAVASIDVQPPFDLHFGSDVLPTRVVVSCSS